MATKLFTRSLATIAVAAILLSASITSAEIIIPAGLNPGDTFHLVFVARGTRDATSSNIEDYNNFVQAEAALNPAITGTDLGVQYRAIVSTPTVDARDNALVSAPVYRTDGTLVATGFADMWDGTLLASINRNQWSTQYTGFVLTGSFASGYGVLTHPAYRFGAPWTLGGGRASQVQVGETENGSSWMFREFFTAPDSSSNYPMYALSDPLVVPDQSPTKVQIDSNTVFEEIIGQYVGVLTAIDEDVGQTHTFESLDNRFQVIGNELWQNPTNSFPLGSAGTIDVIIRVTDSGDPALSADLPVQLQVVPVDSPWKNQFNPFDVNADGSVSPIDALLVINYLNSQNNHSLNSIENPPFASGPFWDPSGDRFVSPIDALLVINYLNTHPSGEGEYEPAYLSDRGAIDRDHNSGGDFQDLDSDPLSFHEMAYDSHLMTELADIRRRVRAGRGKDVG